MDGIVKVLILAGGLGTRLKSVSGDIPKPMMPINNIPFLELLIEKINKFNLTDINISISYNPDYFINYFKNQNYNFIVEQEPLGTGGAIKYAIENIGEFDSLIILNGDTFFDINYEELILKHKLHNADITIASKPMEKPYRYGTLDIGNNRVLNFNEKQEIDSGIINCGIYVLNKNIKNKFPNENKFSFEKDFLEKQTSILNIIPFISDNYFIDIGIPEDYFKAVDYFKN